MHILVTRPEADAAEFKKRIEAMGHRVSLCPLLEIVYTRDTLDLDGAQALLATSRNGLKGLVRTGALQRALALPLFAVGPGTASLARELGFAHIIEGPGRGEELCPLISAYTTTDGGDLVHISAAQVAFDLEGALTVLGYSVRREILYESVPARSLTAEAAEAIRDGSLDAVILMSPRTARVFAKLALEAGLASAARNLEFYCISSQVAEALRPLGATKVKIAVRPNAEEILAALAPVTPDSS